MAYKISVKPGAEEEIGIAYNWYEDQKEGLGEEYLKELILYYKKLENTPTAFGKIKRNYRQARIEKIPLRYSFRDNQERSNHLCSVSN